MELSRRGMLGGFAAVGAVGAAGFVGAASVADTDDADTDGNDRGAEDDGDNGEAESAVVDPDAPFEAQLLETVDDNTETQQLFDASDLAGVRGPVAEENEHLVYIVLSDTGIDTFQARLNDSGAADNPTEFAVSMTLDETEVRRVDLDEPTVSALIDEEWTGMLTLPFDEETVAEDVSESLAAE